MDGMGDVVGYDDDTTGNLARGTTDLEKRDAIVANLLAARSKRVVF